jgi:hypothetical protein
MMMRLWKIQYRNCSAKARQRLRPWNSQRLYTRSLGECCTRSCKQMPAGRLDR